MRVVLYKSAFAPWRGPRSYSAMLVPEAVEAAPDYRIQSIRVRTISGAHGGRETSVWECRFCGGAAGGDPPPG